MSRVRLIILVVFVIKAVTSVAQSDNYWSWNFNTPSTLMAGSVIAGSAGPSAVYYNPALIDQEDMPIFSLSASLVSFQSFKAKNIAGYGLDADKTLVKIQPRFLSYTLKSKNERLGFEVSILAPISEEISFVANNLANIDIINRTTGNETYTGYLKYSRKYEDTWVGGGMSYKISERFYIGGSLFFSYKSLVYFLEQQAKAYQENDSVNVSGINEARYIAESGFDQEFKYWYLSSIFKLGGQYRSINNKISIGINFTFPDIPLFGQADVRKELDRNNVFFDNETVFVSNENTIGIEKDLTVRVKNPFSAALGFQYNTKKNAVSFTVEYFHKVDPYAVVESTQQFGWTPDYISNGLSGNSFLSYYFEAKSVTNFAIGFKQYVSPNLIVYGGFRTDFTASISDDKGFVSNRFSITRIQLDKYHFTLGPVWEYKRYKVVTGLQYTHGGNKDMFQMVNYSDPVEYNSETDQSLEGTRQNNVEASLNEIALFLGLTVDLF